MQNVSYASNPGFDNITSFTISGSNLQLMLDDLNFEAPVTHPAITSAIYDATTHQLVVTGTNFVSSGGLNDDVAVSQLTLTGQGGSYGLTSGNVEITDASHFTVTLNATDIINVNGVLNKNGTSAVSAVTYNIAGAAGFIAANASDADLTGNGITVSSVSSPSISSATYDASTGVLTVTGTNLVQTIGATNDITVSTLVMTGEGGATRTLTSANVEVASATSFSVTLNVADRSAVEQIFNKNGSASNSGTTYNLAAADDWDSVINNTDISVATAAITVSNVAVPTITSATYNATTGALVDNGTAFHSGTAAVDDTVAIDVTSTGDGSATHAEAGQHAALGHGHRGGAGRVGQRAVGGAVGGAGSAEGAGLGREHLGHLGDEQAGAGERPAGRWLLAVGDRGLAEAADVQVEGIGARPHGPVVERARADLQGDAGGEPEHATRVDAVDELVVGLLPGDDCVALHVGGDPRPVQRRRRALRGGRVAVHGAPEGRPQLTVEPHEPDLPADEARGGRRRRRVGDDAIGQVRLPARVHREGGVGAEGRVADVQIYGDRRLEAPGARLQAGREHPVDVAELLHPCDEQPAVVARADDGPGRVESLSGVDALRRAPSAIDELGGEDVGATVDTLAIHDAAAAVRRHRDATDVDEIGRGAVDQVGGRDDRARRRRQREDDRPDEGR